MLEYEGARIQLLDLPGIVQDAAKGTFTSSVSWVSRADGQVVEEVGRSCLSPKRQI